MKRSVGVRFLELRWRAASNRDSRRIKPTDARVRWRRPQGDFRKDEGMANHHSDYSGYVCYLPSRGEILLMEGTSREYFRITPDQFKALINRGILPYSAVSATVDLNLYDFGRLHGELWRIGREHQLREAGTVHRIRKRFDALRA